MRVPCVAGARREANEADPNARRLLARGDDINPGIACECLGWGFARRLFRLDLHRFFLSLSTDRQAWRPAIAAASRPTAITMTSVARLLPFSSSCRCSRADASS